MKKSILIALSFSCSIAFAQKLDNKSIDVRGPFKPLDSSFDNVISTNSKFLYNSNIPATLRDNKIPFSETEWTQGLMLGGYKTDINPDLNITFDLKEFEVVDVFSFQKAPAAKIGSAAELIIKNKAGDVVYSRTSAPKVLTYLYDDGVSIETVAKRVVYSLYNSMIKDFKVTSLYQPYWSVDQFALTAPKKSDKDFVEKFNQSADVFAYLNSVERNTWPSLFEDVRKYWEGLRKYNGDKDKNVNQRIRFASNYNLAVSYFLTNEVEKAESYFEDVKANEDKFLGMYTYYPKLKDYSQLFKETKSERENTLNSKIERIQQLNTNPLYKDSPNKFREINLLASEVKTKKGEVLGGDIRVNITTPPKVDWRKGESKQSSLGQIGSLIKSTSSEDSPVRIKIPNQKKDEKLDLSDIVTIKNNEGTEFEVFNVGTMLDNDKRISIMQKKQTVGQFQLYEEHFPFPGKAYFKRIKDANVYEFDSLTPKKGLMKYFESCPSMVKAINNGEYLLNTDNIVQRIFEDAGKSCK